jgi:hypothetical protein
METVIATITIRRCMLPVFRVAGSSLLPTLVLAACLASSAKAQPANDNCSSAIPVAGLPFVDTQDTTSATTEAGDPVTCSATQETNSVWYTYTAANNGFLQIDSLGSSYNAHLSFYSGTCGALTLIADEPCYYGPNTWLVRVRGGETTHIEASDYFGSGGGTLKLNAQRAHDSVVRLRPPKTINIPIGKSSVSKKIPVVVANADLFDPPPGHDVTLMATSSCPSIATSATIDFDPKTSGNQGTVSGLAAGKSKTATLTLVVVSPGANSPNPKSPERCYVSLSASSPTIDPAPDNAQYNWFFDVIDNNDF